MKRKISLILIALLSMLTLTSCIFGKYTYNQGSKYTEYTGRTEIEDKITKLQINWVSGKVHILKGSTLAFEERGGKGEYLPLYYYVDEGTLYIQYAKNNTDAQYLKDNTKELLITVPEDVEVLELDTVTADYDIDIGDIKTIDIDAVSGKGTVVCGLCSTVDIDTVSGYVKLAVKHSHDLELIDIDSTSADAELYFDGIRSFDTTFNSTSGGYTADFFQGSDNTYTPFKINYDSVSGSLYIHKLNGN